MNIITIAWIVLPFFLGFVIYLCPRFDRSLALVTSLASAAYAVLLFTQPIPVALQLLDHFGVTLIADSLSGFFILTNALVTMAVLFYCWQSGKSAFFMLRRLFCMVVSMLLLFVPTLLACMWRWKF